MAACFGSIGDVSMGFVTGVPLACGLELLLKGSLTQHGVMAPESGAMDPHEFFTALDAKEGSGGRDARLDALLGSGCAQELPGKSGEGTRRVTSGRGGAPCKLRFLDRPFS